MTEEYKGVFDKLEEVIVESYNYWQQVEGKLDPCKNINKEEEPIENRLGELEKKWAKNSDYQTRPC